MKTIIVSILVCGEGWRKFIFELPSDACALVESGLRNTYPKFYFIEADYVQLIYEIGGGIGMFFIPCH